MITKENKNLLNVKQLPGFYEENLEQIKIFTNN